MTKLFTEYKKSKYLVFWFFLNVFSVKKIRYYNMRKSYFYDLIETLMIDPFHAN